MQLGVPRATRQSVCDLILATQHNAPPADPDAALLVEIENERPAYCSNAFHRVP
jgi:predicted metal-dependent HD superfamily phosphohydrolase